MRRRLLLVSVGITLLILAALAWYARTHPVLPDL